MNTASMGLPPLKKLRFSVSSGLTPGRGMAGAVDDEAGGDQVANHHVQTPQEPSSVPSTFLPRRVKANLRCHDWAFPPRAVVRRSSKQTGFEERISPFRYSRNT